MSATALQRFRLPPKLLVGVTALLALEAVALVTYVAATGATFTAPRYVLYPVAWVNAGLLAIWYVGPTSGGWTRRRVAGVLVGVAYFLALAWIGGAVAFGDAAGIEVHWSLPPGWGPLVIAGVGPLRIAPTPYRLFGYAALAYLVYAAAADAEATPVNAVLGLFSCVSCTLPVLGIVLSSALGSAAGVGAVSAYSYDLSTLVYLAAIALLAFRPDVALVRRLRRQ